MESEQESTNGPCEEEATWTFRLLLDCFSTSALITRPNVDNDLLIYVNDKITANVFPHGKHTTSVERPTTIPSLRRSPSEPASFCRSLNKTPTVRLVRGTAYLPARSTRLISDDLVVVPPPGFGDFCTNCIFTIV